MNEQERIYKVKAIAEYAQDLEDTISYLTGRFIHGADDLADWERENVPFQLAKIEVLRETLNWLLSNAGC